FNPLTPMPGTGLYDRLRADNALLSPTWWIDPSYRYGDPIFKPKSMSASELHDGPMHSRRAFYSWQSILSRAAHGFVLWRRPRSVAIMLLGNWVSRREIARKQNQQLSAPAITARESQTA
ncbi:MAG: hypothetical protein ABL893_01395, partial [Hyphomicrobium sp.]